MDPQKDKFEPHVPDIAQVEDIEMVAEFTKEAAALLDQSDAAIRNLRAYPHDKEIVDKAFKVFHTIRGLAGFLHLEDIELLCRQTERLVDMVRKSEVALDEYVGDLVLKAAYDLKKLLSLLDEQVNHQGRLPGPYYDISFVLDQIHIVCGRTGGAVDREKLNRDLADITGVRNPSVELESLKGRYDELLKKFKDLMDEHEKLRQSKGQGDKNTEKRNAFFVNTAHEIRVLLNVILGFSKLIQKSEMDVKQKDYIETIVSSGELLLNIVNGILDFSKIETGHLILENIEFRLRELIDGVFRIIRAKVKGSAVKIDRRIADDVPDLLTGDPTRLKQVLINLIDNALKFTDRGEITVFVEQAPQEDGASPPKECVLLFKVRDTGIGIPREKQEQIFESFVQADDSITRQYGGTGLGLSICRSFIEAMGGTIKVESQEGKGSTFLFTVHFSVTRQEKEDKVSEQEEKKATPEDAREASCRGIRVLVAEDSATNQELMKVYFETFGCQGDFVDNGQQAVQRMKSGSYDICFMDVEMPVMNGIEATKTIRREVDSAIPIVALTAAVRDEEKEACLEAGMSDYLAKPFDMHDLKRKILLNTQKRQ